jgi:hypothetical protein
VLKAKFDELSAAAEPPGSGQSIRFPQSIKLSLESPKIFNMVRTWVYAVAFGAKGQVPKIEENEPDPDIEEVKVEEGAAQGVPLPGAAVSTASPREIFELYVLANKLEIIGLKNAAIDALFHYYHGPDAVYSVAEQPTQQRGQPEGRKPRMRKVRRCPNLHDVEYVFKNTNRTHKIRSLLMVTCLFYVFFKKKSRSLPAEWKEVMVKENEIGYEMVKTIATWNWAMGDTVPMMRIRNPCEFHDAHEHGVTGPCGSIRISGENSLR